MVGVGLGLGRRARQNRNILRGCAIIFFATIRQSGVAAAGVAGVSEVKRK